MLVVGLAVDRQLVVAILDHSLKGHSNRHQTTIATLFKSTISKSSLAEREQ
jgi:hypothetical protein